MRLARVTFACFLLLCLCAVAGAQNSRSPRPRKQKSLVEVERELKEFYESYAEDLRKHRRDAIADRYDRRGIFFLGQGTKTLESFEANKKHYQTKWTGPKSFEWKDISIEVLSRDAAVVVGRFEWQAQTGETLKFSYTALLIRDSGRWRIRVEDESSQPVKPSAP